MILAAERCSLESSAWGMTGLLPENSPLSIVTQDHHVVLVEWNTDGLKAY